MTPQRPGDGVPPDDPGFLHGEALFETLRLVDGRLWWMERHLGRLRTSAERLGWEGVADESALRSALAEAVTERPGGDGTERVRLTATNGGHTVVSRAPIGSPRPPHAITVRGAWSRHQVLAEHKTTSYAGYALAQRTAEAAGTGHAILLDENGAPGEAATANLFVVVDGVLATPPAHGLLSGIARQVLIERLRPDVEEISSADFERAEEVFAVSALRGASPILTIDGRPVGTGQPGPRAGAANASLIRSGIEEATTP